MWYLVFVLLPPTIFFNVWKVETHLCSHNSWSFVEVGTICGNSLVSFSKKGIPIPVLQHKGKLIQSCLYSGMPHLLTTPDLIKRSRLIQILDELSALSQKEIWIQKSQSSGPPERKLCKLGSYGWPCSTTGVKRSTKDPSAFIL